MNFEGVYLVDEYYNIRPVLLLLRRPLVAFLYNPSSRIAY